MSNVPDDDPIVVCAFSGETRPRSRMVRIGELWVTPENKDAYVQFLKEGGDIDGTVPRPAKVVAEACSLRFGALLLHAWVLMGNHAGVVLGAAAVGGIVQGLLVHGLRSAQAELFTSNHRHIDGPFMLMGFIAVIAGVVVRSLYVSIIQLHAWHTLQYQRVTTEFLAKEAFRHWAQAMWARMALGLSLVLGWFVFVIGSAFFATRYWLAPCCAIIAPNRSSTKASKRLVQGVGWRVFFSICCVRLITGLPFIIWHKLPQWFMINMFPGTAWARKHFPYPRSDWPMSLFTDMVISLPLVLAVIFDMVLCHALSQRSPEALAADPAA